MFFRGLSVSTLAGGDRGVGADGQAVNYPRVYTRDLNYSCDGSPGRGGGGAAGSPGGPLPLSAGASRFPSPAVLARERVPGGDNPFAF